MGTRDMGLWKRAERAFLLSLVVMIAAQFNISLFNNNFKISIGILFLPVFLFLLDDVPLIPITVCSGIGIFLSRFLFSLHLHDSVQEIILACYPEAFFYIVYGLLLYLYVRKTNPFPDKKLNPIPFFFMDYAANLVELMLRNDVPTFSFSTQLGILGVALVRSILILAIITLFRHYHLVLLRQEHANRYQQLMLLISKLSGEVVWMKKNTTLIEKTMNASYRLFSTLKEHDDIDPELARTALNVAKDIHEIKKEYNLILRGISDALDLNLQGDGMYLEEMLRILETATRNKAQEAERHLILTAELPAHIYTQKHYFLMSILRNLFTNAVEASDQETVCLKLAITLENQQYQIAVTDNGPGIDPEDLDQIFQPGFSTKINYTTGEVSRGLGLNLVQDLITNQFHGSIRVDSHPGCTTFTMTIPQNELEENI